MTAPLSKSYLTPVELRALALMQDNHWRTPAELCNMLGDHSSGLVRSVLQQLAARRLVERGGWGESLRWGEWRITDAGIAQVAAHDQLELL